jgi:hypothetical protein
MFYSQRWGSLVIFRATLIAILTTGLTACGWVDSTGRQPASSDATTLVDGGQLLLLENSPRAAAFFGANSGLTGWQWQAQGATIDSNCSIHTGYDTSLAAESLEEACTDSDACLIEVVEQTNNGSAQFSILAPSLKAPVAIDYSITTDDEQGNAIELNQTLCLVAVNEAPFAKDDEYTVLRNITHEVTAEDPNSLLSNDEDDLDIRNQPLQINPVPLLAPQFADSFELGTDGSFIYTPTSSIDPDSGVIEDTFIYELTDGLHNASATVKIQIVTNNTAPIRTTRTDLLSLSVEEHGESGFSFDLSNNFFDADGDELSFRTTAGSLPSSDNITINPDGVLSGKPQRVDEGDYIVTVVASDGIGQVADTFILSITRFAFDNSAPEVDDIPNRVVRDEFSYDVAQFFEDDDDDELRFSATGLPSGTSISSSGVILGEANNQNTGSWLITVTASDGRGGSVNDSFRLIIR